MIRCENKKLFVIIILSVIFFMNKTNADYEKIFFDLNIKSLDGKNIELSEFKNKAVLVVNVASNCGFTKQYTDLQNLYDNYKDNDFIVIAIPSNQFGNQEPGSNKEIKDFCETNFNITFPIMSKYDVKGENAHPIYKWAKQNFGSPAVPKWNFHKILINKDGKIIDTFSSLTKPLSNKIIAKIEKHL